MGIKGVARPEELLDALFDSKGRLMRQLWDHQPHPPHTPESLAGYRSSFVALAESAILSWRGQSAPDSPALRQHVETTRNRRWGLARLRPDAFRAGPPILDDLYINVRKVLGSLAAKTAFVATIDLQLVDAEKPLGQTVQDQDAPVGGIYVRRMHTRRQRQALCIHNQMAFACLDLPAPIIAAFWPANVGSFGRLIVDDRGTRLEVSTEAASHQFAQCHVDRWLSTRTPGATLESSGRRFSTPTHSQFWSCRISRSAACGGRRSRAVHSFSVRVPGYGNHPFSIR